MGEKIRKTISLLISIGVTILAFYVGIFKLFLGPLSDTFHLFFSDALTIRIFMINVMKMILSSTATGAIWCGGYIVSHWFYQRTYDDEYQTAKRTKNKDKGKDKQSEDRQHEDKRNDGV